jgi:membrane-bound lytic murein transglycosylase B
LIILALFSSSVMAENPPFAEWLAEIRQQALAQGISEKTVAILDGIERDPRVITFDRRQPEFVQTFDEYLTARVSDQRIDRGRREFIENRAVLRQIGDQYGVDEEYIVSFWGLETSFGQYQGKYSIVRSLATLGHDERRSAFFTKELFEALSILDEGHIAPDQFVGAWAGAMGQSQFLPSAFNRFAQDFDGDGRKDIWNNEKDVWASIANYLALNGWEKGQDWGARVTVPDDLDVAGLMPGSFEQGCRAVRSHTRKIDLAQWRMLGVSMKKPLPGGRYALVRPEEGASESWLVGGNFRAILRYNCANKYAVSVGLLADLIRDPQASP